MYLKERTIGVGREKKKGKQSSRTTAEKKEE